MVVWTEERRVEKENEIQEVMRGVTVSGKGALPVLGSLTAPSCRITSPSAHRDGWGEKKQKKQLARAHANTRHA